MAEYRDFAVAHQQLIQLANLTLLNEEGLPVLVAMHVAEGAIGHFAVLPSPPPHLLSPMLEGFFNGGIDVPFPDSGDKRPNLVAFMAEAHERQIRASSLSAAKVLADRHAQADLDEEAGEAPRIVVTTLLYDGTTWASINNPLAVLSDRRTVIAGDLSAAMAAAGRMSAGRMVPPLRRMTH